MLTNDSKIPRRKSCHHFNTPDHAHELTFACHNNRPFLLNSHFCQYLADAIVKARSAQQFDLWAYVFMPDHVHLLIRPRLQEYSISNILKTIKQSTARKVLSHVRWHTPEMLVLMTTDQKHAQYRFWRDGGGYDRNLMTTAAIHHAIDYIHNNPARKGLVTLPEDWIWSSIRDWRGEGLGSIPVDIDSFPVV
jgi:putative transposase